VLPSEGDSVGDAVKVTDGRRVGTSVDLSDGTNVVSQVALTLGLSLVGYHVNEDSFTLMLLGVLLGSSIKVAFNGDEDSDGTRVGTSVAASEGRRVGTGEVA
jgi:hypothetical protein